MLLCEEGVTFLSGDPWPSTDDRRSVLAEHHRHAVQGEIEHAKHMCGAHSGHDSHGWTQSLPGVVLGSMREPVADLWDVTGHQADISDAFDI
jgi:hypothetical protein